MDTPNFNEIDVQGKSYQRTGRVVIDNLLGTAPHLTTVEEFVEPARGGGVKCTPYKNLTLTFDPSNPKHMLLYTTMNEIIIELRLADEAALEVTL